MDKIFRSGAILLACSATASLFSYVFFMMAGKRITPDEYSALGFMLSFYFVSGVISGTIYNVVVRYVSYFKAKSQDEKLHQFFINTVLLSAAIGLFAFFIIAISSGAIGSKLGTSRWPVIFLGAFILTYFVVNTMLAMINGMQRFTQLGVYRVVSAAVLVSAGFLLLPFGTSGVLLSLLASEAAIFIPLLFSLKGLFLYKRTGTGDIGIAGYLLKALAASVLLAILVNIDVVLVRLFFQSTDAGNYAAASFIAKLPLIVSGGLVAVFFPKVAELDSNGNDSLPLLKQALIYTGSIAALTFMAYILLPRFVASLIFSSSYDIAWMIPWLALPMGIFAIINVLVMYYLAKGSFAFMPFLFAAGLFMTLGIIAYHGSLSDVIMIMNLVAIGAALTLAVRLREDLVYIVKKKSGFRKFDFVRMWARLEHKDR